VRIGYLATVGEVLLPAPSPYEFSAFEEGVVNEWFDRLPDGAVFRHQLNRNRDSGDRVARIARVAPRLGIMLSDQVEVTELVLSGEIMESPPGRRTVNRGNYARNCALTLAYEVLNRGPDTDPDESLEETLTDFADAVILSTAQEAGLTAQIYGLGSLGNRLMAPNSDADLLFLAEVDQRDEAERAASIFLRTLREAGLFSVDLRLRPDGGKGLLVRTPGALRYYSDTDMDPWERFALGHARPLGETWDIELLYEIAYAGLSDSDVASLADMKRRIETERVESQHGSRNVKLGPGGLLDIEWLVHLCEMRYVTAMDVAPGKRFSDRIRSLNGAGLMNALETESLLQAHRWLLDLRVAIWLQGSDGDVLPENPDKLDRIAEFMGDNNGNATLAKHADTVSMVRKLYEMAWEILAR
jgi:glutamate-ammonia-ligase adenylyltransferase